MSGISVYMEGGGETPGTKAEIRDGMNAFLGSLRESARLKRWRWKVVPCGGRNRARDAFLNARVTEPHLHAILLVDSETVVAGLPKQHLMTRDRWPLAEIPDTSVHLMAQIMETWLASDPDRLQGFYKQGFNVAALPRHQDIEQVGKTEIEQALEYATRHTQKGRYHKIRHGGPLLRLVQAATVRARCTHCERLFLEIGRLLAQPSSAGSLS